MNPRKTLPLAILMAFVVLVPYGYAYIHSGPQYVFGGFLLNPVDGNSYLAKMYQGWEGSWRFILPYTAQQGQGAYLFLYYLFLGHIARWMGLSLALVFHAARALNAFLLIFALNGFYRKLFPEHPRQARLALLLAVFGSGMGWVVTLAGGFTSDLWVAEAYPFLSMYANPHFPLGMALLLWIFTLLLTPSSLKNNLILLALGLLLAVVMPFGLVVAGVVCAAKFAWDWSAERCFIVWPYLALFSAGGMYLLYQLWISSTDPVLAGWNAQNMTPSPALWDFILSLSPALLLGLAALPAAWKERANPASRLLLAWFVLGALLVYAPFSLQRRFMTGYFIPAAAMAVWGISVLRAKLKGAGRWLVPALFVLSVPTNLIVLASGVFGAAAYNPALYLRADESAAMQWAQAHTPPHALILADKQMGLFIPAWTGRRVIYGHPFETVNAAQEEASVNRFFSGQMDAARAEAFLKERGVEYVFCRTQEASLASLNLPVMYRNDEVIIYRGAAQP